MWFTSLVRNDPEGHVAITNIGNLEADHEITNPSRLPQYSVITFESRNGLHAHIVFVGTCEIRRRLKASAQFGELLDVRLVTDTAVLVHGYLAKERTPQAGYRRAHMLGGRIRGSHRLPGGGDRVRLSRQLERDSVEAGYVASWQHTNARRSLARKLYGPRRRVYISLPGGQAPLAWGSNERTHTASRLVSSPS